MVQFVAQKKKGRAVTAVESLVKYQHQTPTPNRHTWQQGRPVVELYPECSQEFVHSPAADERGSQHANAPPLTTFFRLRGLEVPCLYCGATG